MSARLELDGVRRRYDGVEALRGIDLGVEPSELVAIVGPSGSGKSTLLRVIAGLEPLDAGRVLIDGADQAQVAPVHRHVAMVFQSFALFPHLSVERNIAFGLRARRAEPAEIAERVRATAEELGLEGLLDRRPGELSGGERQRVALARALAGRPRLLLLDEPLSNLDAQLRESARTLIRRVQEETGVTTVHVTHDQAEALALGHRVVVLRDGAVEQAGTPDEVWDHPATAWIAAFIGTPPMNLLPARVAATLGLAAGAQDELLVGFRPEHATPEASARPTGLVLEAVERAGADHLWRLRAGEHAVAARGPDGVRVPEKGTPVAIRVEPSRVRLFDAATGGAL